MNALHDSLEELVEGEEGEKGGWEVEYSVSLAPSFAMLLFDWSSSWSSKRERWYFDGSEG